MKETYNWKSLFAGAIIILVGSGFCVWSAYSKNPWDTILLSVGCSLIASGLVKQAILSLLMVKLY